MNKIFYIILVLLVIVACEKEEIPVEEVDPTVTITGRSVNYTLQVILADDYTKTTNTAINAEVQLSTANGIVAHNTDSAGRVNFTNLASGVVSVSVKYENYTSAEMLVNLAQTNEDSFYDSNNIRNVSTILKLYPTSGESMATIKGKVFADLNLANDTAGTHLIYQHNYEYTPFKIDFFVKVVTNQFYEGNLSGDGEILNISYSGFNLSEKSDNLGNFEIQVPASLNGLEYYIKFNDFEYNQVIMDNYPSTIEERKIFFPDSIFVNVVSGNTKIIDIFYNY